jgi:hypothetical protein
MGKIAEAKSQMLQAADFDPQGHTFTVDFAKTFANDVEYQVWRIAGKRLGLNFEENFKNLVAEMASASPAPTGQ